MSWHFFTLESGNLCIGICELPAAFYPYKNHKNAPWRAYLDHILQRAIVIDQHMPSILIRPQNPAVNCAQNLNFRIFLALLQKFSDRV